MPFRQVILHNFWLKVISLGLASLIWIGVNYQIKNDYGVNQPRGSRPVFKRSLKVRVAAITSGDGHAYKVSPREVTVVLLGEEGLLSKISPTNFMVYADLTDFTAHKSTLAEVKSHAPPDVLVGDIQPAFVTVEPISP